MLIKRIPCLTGIFLGMCFHGGVIMSTASFSIQNIADTRRIKRIVGKYGFIEIAYILHFLTVFCQGSLRDSDCLYIRNELAKCLKAHDDSSEYFIPLRELATELDCLIEGHMLD